MSMSMDLILKPSCVGCGSTHELYGSTCKHLTLCVNCGKTFAETRRPCYECGKPITRLIREYNVRACPSNDKNYFIGRFTAGLPNLGKKKENKWSLQKEGLQGRQVSDTLREKFKNRPWLLEDETGQFQYQGQLEGSQSATYYLLVPQGKEFVAIPAGSWYNFTKVAQYKQLTLEEAEEKMKNRRKTADGYERWMMKAANNGAAAFGEVEIDREPAAGGGKGGRKKSTGGDEDEGNASDKGDEDEEEEASRKNRLGLKKGGDDDEEDMRGGDPDFDDDDIEKGDDWEHTEIFTDDDETNDVDPEEREHLAPEIPAPPEIKQDDEDEDLEDVEGGGLSKSGKELKKLLGKSNGLDESDDDDDDSDDEDDISPVLPVKTEAPKEEAIDNPSPAKTTGTSGAGRGTPPASKNSKGKRKSNGDESKQTNGTPLKKVKTESDVKSVKDEPSSTSRNSAPPKSATSSTSTVTGSTAPRTGPVTEGEIRDVLLQKKPVTTQDLVAKFKSRLRSKEDKEAFAATLRKISKIQKTNGANYVVLREHQR